MTVTSFSNISLEAYIQSNTYISDVSRTSYRSGPSKLKSVLNSGVRFMVSQIRGLFHSRFFDSRSLRFMLSSIRDLLDS